MSACGTVIGTAGLVSYDPCNAGGGEGARQLVMVVLSGVVVAAAFVLTFRRPRQAVLRLAAASGLGLAVAGVLLALSASAGECAPQSGEPHLRMSQTPLNDEVSGFGERRGWDLNPRATFRPPTVFKMRRRNA